MNNDEWRKQTLGEMLKAVMEKQQKEGRDSEEWGMLESWRILILNAFAKNLKEKAQDTFHESFKK